MVRAAKEKNRIVDTIEVSPHHIVRVSSLPDDFVYEKFRSKNFVQNGFHIMHNMVIKMNIKTSGVCQKFPQNESGFVKPLQIRIEPPFPRCRGKPSVPKWKVL